MLTPRLEILPAPQRRLWDDLKHTPREFVLYGGTAPALRLGHRHSEDFDFFPTVLLRLRTYAGVFLTWTALK